MALSYLLDTSVLTRIRDPSVFEALEPRLRAAVTARAVMSDLEIGFSARNAAEWDELHEALAVCQRLELIPQDFERALTVQRLLADVGKRGRKVPDLLIAAVAERSHLTVLHYDRDYDHIAEVTHQPVEWVVPAGTVD